MYCIGQCSDDIHCYDIHRVIEPRYSGTPLYYDFNENDLSRVLHCQRPLTKTGIHTAISLDMKYLSYIVSSVSMNSFKANVKPIWHAIITPYGDAEIGLYTIQQSLKEFSIKNEVDHKDIPNEGFMSTFWPSTQDTGFQTKCLLTS